MSIELIGIPEEIVKERQSILTELSDIGVKIGFLKVEIKKNEAEIGTAREAAEELARLGDPDGRDAELRKIPKIVQRAKEKTSELVSAKIQLSGFQGKWNSFRAKLDSLINQREKELEAAQKNLKCAQDVLENSSPAILGKINEISQRA